MLLQHYILTNDLCKIVKSQIRALLFEKCHQTSSIFTVLAKVQNVRQSKVHHRKALLFDLGVNNILLGVLWESHCVEGLGYWDNLCISALTKLVT